MRILSFIAPDDDSVRFGILEGEDRVSEIEDPYQTGGITRTGEDFRLRDCVPMPPTLPMKALCVGLNYRDHAEEFGHPIPSEPVIFMKPSSSVIADGDEIVVPEVSKRVDHEAELAIVIGRDCKDVPEDEANDYILGYTCANDVTARDLQPKNGQWTIAKGFDTFLPLGPWVETEVDPGNLKIEARVNGEVKQSSNTKNLIFNCRFLVSWLSRRMTLNAGDVILTGTPSGVSPLAPGDEVEVEIEGIGILKNGVNR